MASGYLSVSGGASGYPAVVGQVASGAAATVSVSATRRRPRSRAWNATERTTAVVVALVVAHRFELNMAVAARGRAERAASWPTGPAKERAAAPSGATTARPDRPSSARRETPLILACRKGDVAACCHAVRVRVLRLLEGDGDDGGSGDGGASRSGSDSPVAVAATDGSDVYAYISLLSLVRTPLCFVIVWCVMMSRHVQHNAPPRVCVTDKCSVHVQAHHTWI